MTDRAEAGLQGPVKTCHLERDSGSGDSSTTDDTFSPQGLLLERRHRNPGGSHWSIICRYDEHGRILQKEHAGSDPQTHQIYSYLYDRRDRLDRIVVSTPDGERVSESVQYASDGAAVRTCYPDSGLKPDGVSVESMLHISTDTAVAITVFDASDRPLHKVLYDADYRVIRRIAFRYDGQGLLIEEGELVGGRIRHDFRNVYHYDSSGRLIEVDRSSGGLGSIRRSLAYNQYGDITEEKIEHHPDLFMEEPGARVWTERFAYRYDIHDNWVERITETMSQSGEVSHGFAERRELTYY